VLGISSTRKRIRWAVELITKEDFLGGENMAQRFRNKKVAQPVSERESKTIREA